MYDDFDLEEILLKYCVTFNKDLFIKKFGQTPLNIAISENLKDAIQQLIKTQCYFIFLYDSFCEIKRIKILHKLLSKEEKRSLNIIINGIVCIIFALNEILIPISEEINLKKEAKNML